MALPRQIVEAVERSSPVTQYQCFPVDSDCRDLDPAINPGRGEIPGNGIDENCNGNADDVVLVEEPDEGTDSGGGNGDGGGDPTDDPTDDDDTDGTDDDGTGSGMAGGAPGGSAGRGDGGGDGDGDGGLGGPVGLLPSTGASIVIWLAMALSLLTAGLVARTLTRRRRFGSV